MVIEFYYSESLARNGKGFFDYCCGGCDRDLIDCNVNFTVRTKCINYYRDLN